MLAIEQKGTQMKITLRGCNGKKREIHLEELIEKFWDDEQHNPISVEM